MNNTMQFALYLKDGEIIRTDKILSCWPDTTGLLMIRQIVSQDGMPLLVKDGHITRMIPVSKIAKVEIEAGTVPA